MKKLIYNENTREIIINEQEELLGKESGERKPSKSQIWLENKKIFFEIFSYVFVGIMGIVISFVGWKTNQRSADIYQRQLEILDNDREPYFSLSYEKIYEERGEDVYRIINKYTIKNDGGLISDAYLSDIKSYIIIYCANGENIYKYYLDGKFSIPNEQYIYDLDTKKFSFYGEENSRFSVFVEKLESDLAFVLDEYDATVLVNNYITINYVNYKNEKYSKVYEFSRDGIFANIEDDTKKEVVLGRISYDALYETMNIATEIYNYINNTFK